MGNACCSTRCSPEHTEATPSSISSKDFDELEKQDVDNPQSVHSKVTQVRHIVAQIKSLSQATPNFRLLDVGCGNGLITVGLASEIQPSGRVTGLDICGGILVTAKAYAEHSGMDNINFVTGDAHRLPFRDGEFDAVHTHQAVAHFEDPVVAIKELVRVTRPGGMLFLREGHLETARFNSGYELLDECFKVIVEVHKENGSSAAAGAMLMEWAAEAGVPKSDIIVRAPVWRCNTDQARHKFGAHWPGRCVQGVFADRSRALGVSSERLQQYAVEWKRWIDDPGAWLSMSHGELIATVT